MRVETITRECMTCEEPKPLRRFVLRGRRVKRDAYSAECSKCRARRARQAAKRRIAPPARPRKPNDPESLRRRAATKRAYRATERGRFFTSLESHRRRTRKLDLPIEFTLEDWRVCVSYFGHRCAYCDARTQLTQDHFWPLTSPQCRGTTPSNIVPACRRCNSQKTHQDPTKWVRDPTRLAFILAYLDRWNGS